MRAFWDGVRIIISKFGWNDIIDILIVAIIIFKLICFIRDSRSQRLFKGILIFLGVWLIAWVFKLQMVSYIVDLIVRNAGIALVVVFTPEIRDVLERLGRSNKQTVASFFAKGDETLKLRSETLNTISNVVECARVLKKQCMGALIVFERNVNLDSVIATGITLDIVPNAKILSNIFYNKAPLHDGAVVIRENKICAASCILPLTQRTDIDADLGTRHRAGIGMSEQSDAVIVVVSEETGRFSVVSGGKLKSFYDPAELSSELISQLLPPEDDYDHDSNSFFSRIRGALRRSFGIKKNEKNNANGGDADEQ